MFKRCLPLALSPALLLAACATAPMGPTVQVMPAATKPFQIFQEDQTDCKTYANTQVAGQADAANKKAVTTALLGTALGGALGGALGDRQGAPGAAAGAVVGTGVASNGVNNAQASIQDQYNTAYVQCMYSKGNIVPGALPQSADATPPAAPAPQQPPRAADAPHPAGAVTLAQAQSLLTTRGYYKGAADGVMGPHTHVALKAFQKDHALPATGDLDAATGAALLQ